MISIIFLDDRDVNINGAKSALGYLKDPNNNSSDKWFDELTVSYDIELGDANEVGRPLSKEQLSEILVALDTNKDTIVILDLHYPWVDNLTTYNQQKQFHKIRDYPAFYNDRLPLHRDAHGGIWLGEVIIDHRNDTCEQNKHGRLLLVVTSTAAATIGATALLKDKSKHNNIKVGNIINNFSSGEKECRGLWREIKRLWEDGFETDPFERFISELNNSFDRSPFGLTAHDWMDSNIDLLKYLVTEILGLKIYDQNNYLDVNIIEYACKSIYNAGRPKITLWALWILTLAAHIEAGRKSKRSISGKFSWPDSDTASTEFKDFYIYRHPDIDEKKERSQGIEILRVYWKMCLHLFKEKGDDQVLSLDICSLSEERQLEMTFFWQGETICKKIRKLNEEDDSLEDSSKTGSASSRAVHKFSKFITSNQENLTHYRFCNFQAQEQDGKFCIKIKSSQPIDPITNE